MNVHGLAGRAPARAARSWRRFTPASPSARWPAPASAVSWPRPGWASRPHLAPRRHGALVGVRATASCCRAGWTPRPRGRWWRGRRGRSPPCGLVRVLRGALGGRRERLGRRVPRRRSRRRAGAGRRGSGRLLVRRGLRAAGGRRGSRSGWALRLARGGAGLARRRAWRVAVSWARRQGAATRASRPWASAWPRCFPLASAPPRPRQTPGPAVAAVSGHGLHAASLDRSARACGRRSRRSVGLRCGAASLGGGARAPRPRRWPGRVQTLRSELAEEVDPEVVHQRTAPRSSAGELVGVEQHAHHHQDHVPRPR